MALFSLQSADKISQENQGKLNIFEENFNSDKIW